MKVTKYPQSCIIIEHNAKRLAIDPGALVRAKFSAQDLLPLDAILITHEHSDHADPEFLGALLASRPVPVIANQATKKVLGELVGQVVADGEQFEAAGFHITARELPHCLLSDGSPGPQNTGYLIDDTFFHAGDGVALQGLRVPNAAIPIAGPDISSKDAFAFIKQLGCQKVIPIHYNFFLEDPNLLAQFAADIIPDVQFIVLDDGQTTEI